MQGQVELLENLGDDSVVLKSYRSKVLGQPLFLV